MLQFLSTNHHGTIIRASGPNRPARVAIPLRLTPWWSQWNRERRCARAIGHCWHSSDTGDYWDCCNCAGMVEGIPVHDCRLCKESMLDG